MQNSKDTVEKMERYFEKRVRLRERGAPARIDFMSHRHTFWHCLAPLMLECRSRKCFTPRCIIGTAGDAQGDSVAQETAWAEEHGIPWMRVGDYVPAQERADVLCFTTPYPHTYGKEFYTTALAAHGTRPVLIPYCTEWLGGSRFSYNYFHATLPFWRVFAASELSQSYYHEYQDMPQEFVPVTGNPEFDVLHHWKPLQKYAYIKDMAKGRKVLLWTPHYDIDGVYKWSTWNTLSEKIIYMLRQYKDDIFVVLRPHHFLREGLESWRVGQEPEHPLQGAAKDMHEAGNFWLDTCGQSIESVHACTALLSDCSSMLAKALALRKSVCYTPSVAGDGAAEIAALLDGVVHFASDVTSLHRFIQGLLEGEGEKGKPPQKIVQYLCGVADGEAAVRMADHLSQHFWPSRLER